MFHHDHRRAGAPATAPKRRVTTAPTARPQRADAGPWLVVGADGIVGRELARRWNAAGGEVIGTTRRPAGPKAAALHLDLAADAPDWHLPDRAAVAFLCAAVTSCDQCRQHPDDTRRVNVERTLELAGVLRNRGAHLVFLSTNQVHDGSRPAVPPDAPTRPRTEYGRQKATVERELLAGGGAAVVRFGKIVPPVVPLLRAWADALGRGEPIEPLADLVVAPVPLAFAADVLVRIGERRTTGIVQVSAGQDVSYADIARRVADWLGAPRGLVRPVTVAAKGLLPEVAPANTTLDTTRLRRELGLTPPPVEETIDALLEEVTRD